MPKRVFFDLIKLMSALYVISTPIGNLGDTSQRAVDILKNVDLILCEDTRKTQKLLNYFGIKKPTTSYHQHSRLNKMEYILKKLNEGNILGLVSDAGTPTISDPGAKLVSYLLKEKPELKIIPIPGPSALISALSVSGFMADRFVFLGFPPAKKKRKRFFTEAVNFSQTIVFYESPHRMIKTLNELKDLTDRNIVVCRELTKKFETIYRGGIKEVIKEIEKDKIKGEFVVIIENER